jgi:steroid 5-alpha reductase family enzyme
LNALVIAPELSSFGRADVRWLTDPRFVVGASIFWGGYALNRAADRALIRLRAPGQSGYQIPRGPLCRCVSCPNYLGEIVQWFGFALATWSLAGLAFALYTAANVGPRALSHHRDYRERFVDYPADRRALIPFIL